MSWLQVSAAVSILVSGFAAALWYWRNNSTLTHAETKPQDWQETKQDSFRFARFQCGFAQDNAAIIVVAHNGHVAVVDCLLAVPGFDATARNNAAIIRAAEGAGHCSGYLLMK
eukprot:TRINITY_DN10643_c0_g3_i1.p1 TRINITY_DN10643_c0_g3~~TRINITY_DN10643_c0_g3_i1.p1  ORF type:complete len:113 (-),score=6.86 TRINITY_DN10643_c0_g3_i1:33-371(-)